MEILGLILVAVISIIGASIFRGFVFTYLWKWFVVPFGVPAISIAWAIGLSMVVTFLTYEGASSGKKKEWWEPLMASFGQSALVLFFGWIVHLFM